MAHRAPRSCLRAGLAFGCVAALAGCGSGAGSGGTATSAPHRADVEFADCMRANGVPDFPDPLPRGGFPRGSAGTQSSPASQAAQKVCAHLLGGGVGSHGGPTSAQLAAAVGYARCMRAHGVPDFPDPATSQVPRGADVLVTGSIKFALPSTIDPQAPAFQQADAACGQAPGGRPQGG